ncbi:MAG: hypothetical protein NVS3B3_12270 [Aquirhabdus sp.]
MPPNKVFLSKSFVAAALIEVPLFGEEFALAESASIKAHNITSIDNTRRETSEKMTEMFAVLEVEFTVD